MNDQNITDIISADSKSQSNCKHVIKLSFTNVESTNDTKEHYSNIYKHVYFVNSNKLIEQTVSESSEEKNFDNVLYDLKNLPLSINGTTSTSVILKQYSDIKLLISQFYEMLDQKINVISSNESAVSEEEKNNSANISVPIVLYVIESSWINQWVQNVRSSRECLTLNSIENSTLISSIGSLLPNLSEVIDFFFLPREAWKALTSWYGGGNHAFPVQCTVSLENVQNEIEESYYDVILNDVCISSYSLRKIIPNVTLIYDLYKNVISESNSASFHDNVLCFPSPTKPLKPSVDNSTISKASIELSSYVYTDSGLLGKSIAGQCFVCHDKSKYRCIKCSVIYYCSQKCQKIHWKYHKNWCNYAKNYNNLPPQQFQHVVPIGKRGKLGLLNLGNSCYMNSSLQCLSHISTLTNYIISEKYKDDLNCENRDGTGGLLVEEYFNLLRDMWLDNKTVVSPAGIKRVLGRINRDYAGAQQHDAHEVTMLILDKLHEDLNLVRNKPYTMNPEGNGNNDDEISKEAWEKHLLRENSMIQKLIGGLVRNEINCQICKKKVIQFDYQQTVQLAIPKSQNRVIYVLYAPNVNNSSNDNDTNLPFLLSLNVDKLFTFKQLKLQILKQYKHLFENQKDKHNSNSDIDLTINSDNFLGFDVDKQSLTLLSYIQDNSNMINISNDNFIILYPKVNKNISTNYYCVLYQRIFDPTISQDNERFTYEVSGIPILLPIQYNWSCFRVRVMILEQVERFIDPLSIIGKIYYSLLQSVGRIKTHLIVAKYLPIRIVDKRGFGNIVLNAVSVDSLLDSNNEYDIMKPHSLYDASNKLYGSILPIDTKLKLADYLNITSLDDIFFLSVDWSHNWLQAINIDEISMVELSIPSIQSLLTINNNKSQIISFKDKKCAKITKLFLSKKSVKSSNPINDSCITIEQCLNEHTKTEVLEKGNEWYCSNCKKHQLATKNVLFWKPILPKILIISLKRFEYRELSGNLVDRFGNTPTFREKIEDFIDFPLEGLDLSSYCYNTGKSNISDSSSIYDLFAVCNHYGRMGFGHYTTFARDYIDKSLSSQWYAFDDDVVKRCIDPNEVKTKAAYILYYRLRE